MNDERVSGVGVPLASNAESIGQFPLKLSSFACYAYQYSIFSFHCACCSAFRRQVVAVSVSKTERRFGKKCADHDH